MKIYDKIFDWYCDSRNPDAGVEVIRLFAEKLQPEATILDIGCGTGTPITATLLELGINPYGIDSSIKMVTEFKKTFPDVPVQHSDVLDSNFFNRSFDAVISYGFIFHLSQEQQEIAIEKVANHLQHGGYFLFNSGDEDGGEMSLPEYNGGESFMQYSMSCLNYESTLQRNGMSLTSHYIEDGFGSTIYIAKKVSNDTVLSDNTSHLH